MQLTIAQGDREPPFKRRPAETAPWREEARLPFSREPCWKGVVYGADAAEVKGGGRGFAGDREKRAVGTDAAQMVAAARTFRALHVRALRIGWTEGLLRSLFR
jgi:hypothetical protein